MVTLPKLKKSIHSFLTKEDGKISKEKLMKAGLLLAAVAVAGMKGAEAGCPPASWPAGDPAIGAHCNELGLVHQNNQISGTHNHAAHSSHAQHGSHCSGSGDPW